MNSESKSVVVRHEQPVSLPDMQVMAKNIAEGGMFGIKSEAQAMSLMLLCQAEGLHPILALRRYHIIDNKPAFRADALQGEFEREGAILWHVRDDKECSATFWRHGDALVKDSREAFERAVKRAMERYKRMKAGQDVSDLAWPNELTIIRTFDDAVAKRVACSWDTEKSDWKLKKNWRQSPRQMLHARCLTEGVRAINPGLVAGIYTEDEIRDIEPEDTVEAEYVTTERNVTEATANAVVDHTVSQVVPESAIDSGTYGPLKVTQENYKDRIAHFGKPNGNMIGKRVGDLPKEVVFWLHEKWIPNLRPTASDDDLALKVAIEFAYQDLSASPVATEEVKPAPSQPDDIGAKQAALNDLRERIDGLVLTEEQAVSYLIKYFYADAGANWKTLDELPLNVALEWCVPQNWSAFKSKYEAEAKPKVSDEPTEKKKGKRNAKPR